MRRIEGGAEASEIESFMREHTMRTVVAYQRTQAAAASPSDAA